MPYPCRSCQTKTKGAIRIQVAFTPVLQSALHITRGFLLPHPDASECDSRPATRKYTMSLTSAFVQISLPLSPFFPVVHHYARNLPLSHAVHIQGGRLRIVLWRKTQAIYVWDIKRTVNKRTLYHFSVIVAFENALERSILPA